MSGLACWFINNVFFRQNKSILKFLVNEEF
jgi:hypothetical protein